MENFYKYWGKAKNSKYGDLEYPLLTYHCVDVSTVVNGVNI